MKVGDVGIDMYSARCVPGRPELKNSRSLGGVVLHALLAEGVRSEDAGRDNDNGERIDLGPIIKEVECSIRANG